MATERPPAPKPLRPHDLDAIISARLSVPDRPLRNLMAKLNAIAKGSDAEEIARAIASFTLDLESFTLNLGRIESVAHLTTVQEVKNYEDRVAGINAERQGAIEAIASLKRELVNVQQDRQNKLEYDALASEIMKYGTRDELEGSLTSLHQAIERLRGESVKYTEIMHTSEERFEAIALQLEGLRADVGYEVGERERRAVERGGEGDMDDEMETRQGQEAGSDELEGGEERHDGDGESRSSASKRRSALNPSAPSFKPGRGSSQEPSSSVSGKRVRSSRRTGNSTIDEDDRSSSKKLHLEEGEMSDADDEEEEGAA